MKLCTKLRISAARATDDVIIVGNMEIIDFGLVEDDHPFGVDDQGYLHIEGNTAYWRSRRDREMA